MTSWTVGDCSHEVKAASCYAMFDRIADVSQLSGQASSRLTGLLRAARTRDQESGALSGQAATAKPTPTPGSTRYGYVVGGELIAR